jgi:hypothetical protein
VPADAVGRTAETTGAQESVRPFAGVLQSRVAASIMREELLRNRRRAETANTSRLDSGRELPSTKVERELASNATGPDLSDELYFVGDDVREFFVADVATQ